MAADWVWAGDVWFEEEEAADLDEFGATGGFNDMMSPVAWVVIDWTLTGGREGWGFRERCKERQDRQGRLPGRT